MAALAALTSAAQAAPKSANSGHFNANTPPSPLSLVSENNWNNPNSPPWCFAEDDYDQRVYSGSLNGSYSTTEHLCGLSSDFFNGIYWDSGGIGLQATVYAVGTLTDMTITSPTGSVHHAVWVGSSTSKGITTNEYATCFVPPYSIGTGAGGLALSITYIGDPWSITLSGNISSATWDVTAQMAQVSDQEANCPPSEQNLVP